MASTRRVGQVRMKEATVLIPQTMSRTLELKVGMKLYTNNDKEIISAIRDGAVITLKRLSDGNMENKEYTRGEFEGRGVLKLKSVIPIPVEDIFYDKAKTVYDNLIKIGVIK